MIAKILKEKIGFNIASVGQKKIDADVLLRMKKCGIEKLDEYFALLEKSPDEMARLIETVTIPETWFFRMKEAFDYLAEYLHTAQQRPLRLLSIPCSTGEEPYSIAMLCLDNGFKPGEFIIDAADINNLCLEKARAGIYTTNSFRGNYYTAFSHHFHNHGKFHELRPEVRNCVNFFPMNILNYTPPTGPKYDVVFCRNMLIYLDTENQQKTISVLTDSLKSDGLLFLGHAETGIVFNRDFVPVPRSGSFAFQKKSGNTIPTIVTAPPPQPPPPVIPPPRREEAGINVSIPANDQNLEVAERLADQGELTEAENICREYLKTHKLEFKGYFLLGMIMLSQKRYHDAEKALHQALFLNPDQTEALLSLAAVKERLGDATGAARFRERSNRSSRRIGS